MNRFMLSVTVATAAILGAYQTQAQTVVYRLPTISTAEAAPALTLGQFLAARMDGKDANEFKSWLSDASINGNYDIAKGYTLFAVVDSDFDPAKPEHAIEHYIVNDRVGVKTMQGNSDTTTAMNGDKLILSRTNDSYYVDGKRINGIVKNPEGTVYLIGGPVSAFSL